MPRDRNGTFQPQLVKKRQTRLDGFDDKVLSLYARGLKKAWGQQYPAVTQSWRANWERVVPFLDFAPDVRRILYTTNAIESFNARVRKLVNGKGHFPTDDAAFKLIYLAVVAAEKRWTRPANGWSRALNQLTIHLKDDCLSEGASSSYTKDLTNFSNEGLSRASNPRRDHGRFLAAEVWDTMGTHIATLPRRRATGMPRPCATDDFAERYGGDEAKAAVP